MTHAEVLQEALERFQLVAEADSSWRAECLNDLQFSIGDQWPATIKSQREKDGRPCLTMDQLQQSTMLVCNQYRQQRPAIQVNPVGSNADVDTAEIEQGIVRHVEVNSDAELAYDGAHEQVVRTGFGSWRLLSDYIDDESDDQDIFLVPIRNQFSVYWQPGVPQEKATWAFIVTDIPVDTYKSEYKDSKLASLDQFTSEGNNAPEWVTKEYVRVAEYFTVEDVEAGKKRPKKQVRWRKINAVEILDGGPEGKELPGSSIPIFTAYGQDLDVNGKRHVAGLIRNAKDAQRMYNFQNSAATEALALAPKAPWIIAEGQIAGFEKMWEASNTSNQAYLPYKQVDVAGKPAPPPQRNSVEPPIQAMMMLIRQASMDLKASTGLYDPSLGQRKGDESGKAIEHLQSQGDIATFNFSDNMARAMRRCGRLLLEWIKEIYDVPRVQRIIMPDGTIKHVVIHNGADQAKAAQELLTEKITKIYDIGVGRYDVTISVGPSFQTKRQEAVATQLELLKSLPPNVAPMVIDLVVRNMDIPQSREMADRLKKMLPQQLQDDDDSDPEIKVQKLEQTLQQMSQQHELLTKALQEAHQVITTKQIEQQGKTEIAQLQEQSAQAIAKMNNDAKVAVAEITTKSQEVAERIDWLKSVWSDLHGAAHDAAIQAADQHHEKGMQQADLAHQAQMGQQDAAHQSQLQAEGSQQQGELAAQQQEGEQANG